MDFAITTAKYEHLPQLETLEKTCFSMPWSKDSLTNQMLSENCIFLVAENEKGDILGYIGLRFVLDEGYISNVAVAPNGRRCGVASALIDELRARSIKKELSFLTLEVRESNRPAVLLYEKHGFIPVGKRRGYYSKPREDALLMTLFLKKEET